MRKLLTTTSTGPGDGQYLVEAKPRHVFNEHAVQVSFPASTGAITVDLEGSLDGVAWFQIVQHVLTAGELAGGQALFFTNLSPVEHVRGNVIVNSSGDTISMFYAGVVS